MVGYLVWRIRIPVVGPIHFPEMAHHPPGHDVLLLEVARHPWDPGVPAHVHILAIPANVGLEEHGIEEFPLVPQFGIHDAEIGVRFHPLFHFRRVDGLAGGVSFCIPGDIERFQIGAHIKICQRHRSIEDIVCGGEREQSRIDGKVPDAVSRGHLQAVIDVHQFIQGQVPGEQGHHCPDPAIHYTHIVGLILQTVFEDVHEIVRFGLIEMREHDRLDPGIETSISIPYRCLQEALDQEPDGILLTLGSNEVPGELISCLEVIRHRGVFPELDGPESVVPPGEEGRTIVGFCHVVLFLEPFEVR